MEWKFEEWKIENLVCWLLWVTGTVQNIWICAADFSLLNLPKGKSLGCSKPATSSYAQAPQHTVWDNSYYIQALLNCLL